MKCSSCLLALILIGVAGRIHGDDVYLGQGMMSGEVTDTTVLLQTRLTAATALNDQGDLPGTTGFAGFQWSTDEGFRNAQSTTTQHATAATDFIVRTELTNLHPGTRYYYRAVYAGETEALRPGPTGTFKTLPGARSPETVRFLVGSCMNYNKFMHGKLGQSGKSPITATAEDKRLGYPSFAAMQGLNADFFVGTGDIVYYDNKFRPAETLAELRLCWHEQFRFPRLIEFLQHVPAYWSKDDHDFRFNEADNSSQRRPLPRTGIDLFREQLPIVPVGNQDRPTYRTYRVNKHLQLWFSEGRDHRSPNAMADGPGKSLWGRTQKEWLQRTLKASDARWKILITPTPMVGPDSAKKSDNHTNLNGFRHEADTFFDWLQQNQITNFMTVCGDRHWQYHSIHPSGVEEFACGALNDENSVIGYAPGDPRSTDPEALIKQPFKSPEPGGGFLFITAGEELVFELRDDHGKTAYRVVK